MEKFVLTKKETIDSIVNYMTTQPFNEVAISLNDLQNNSQVFNEDILIEKGILTIKENNNEETSS